MVSATRKTELIRIRKYKKKTKKRTKKTHTKSKKDLFGD